MARHYFSVFLTLFVAWGSIEETHAATGNALAFYIAPDGDDGNPGSEAKPFATVGRAQDTVRQLKNQGALQEAVSVFLRGGSYRVSEPIRFTAQDSGTAAAPITYAAYPGEKPVISGGIGIAGWQKEAGPLWHAEVPAVKAGKQYFRQLFVNGRRSTPARIPNGDYLRTAGPGKEPQLHDPESKVSFHYREGDLKPLKNLEDVIVVAYHSWTTSLHRIKSLDQAARLVHLQNPSNWPFGYWEGEQRYVVEFVREGLDAPGEWYLDRKSGRLSYYPRAGEDMTQAQVIAPLAEELLVLEGDPAAGRFVEHLHFRGLTLAHTDWSMPAEERVDNHGAHDLQTAAVRARHARHCVFQQCEIVHTGGYALWLSKGCQDNRIEQCHIHDLGAGGVRIGPVERVTWLDRRARKAEPPYEDDPPIPDSLRAQRNEVFNCFIHDGGHVYKAGIGILIGRGLYNKVHHNEVCDFYYSGISIGWCWEYVASSAHHNLIEYNHVHHLGWGQLSDMGGIYAPGVSPGTKIRNNLIHDLVSYSTNDGWGVYLDDASSEILVENNVAYNTVGGGFFQHFGRDNIVRNNILAFSAAHGQVSFSVPQGHRAFSCTHNIVYYTEPPLLGGNWSDSNTYHLDHNVYWHAAGQTPLFPGDRRLETWQATGQDVHSLIADPRFVDPDHYDFRLKPDSPAMKLGFKPIDLDTIGLVGPSQWVQLPKTVQRPAMPKLGESLWR